MSNRLSRTNVYRTKHWEFKVRRKYYVNKKKRFKSCKVDSIQTNIIKLQDIFYSQTLSHQTIDLELIKNLRHRVLCGKWIKLFTDNIRYYLAAAKKEPFAISINHYLQSNFIKPPDNFQNEIVKTKKEILLDNQVILFLNFFSEDISGPNFILIKEIFKNDKIRRQKLLRHKKMFMHYCIFNNEKFSLSEYLKRY